MSTSVIDLDTKESIEIHNGDYVFEPDAVKFMASRHGLLPRAQLRCSCWNNGVLVPLTIRETHPKHLTIYRFIRVRDTRIYHHPDCPLRSDPDPLIHEPESAPKKVNIDDWFDCEDDTEATAQRKRRRWRHHISYLVGSAYMRVAGLAFMGNVASTTGCPSFTMFSHSLMDRLDEVKIEGMPIIQKLNQSKHSLVFGIIPHPVRYESSWISRDRLPIIPHIQTSHGNWEEFLMSADAAAISCGAKSLVMLSSQQKPPYIFVGQINENNEFNRLYFHPIAFHGNEFVLVDSNLERDVFHMLLANGKLLLKPASHINRIRDLAGWNPFYNVENQMPKYRPDFVCNNLDSFLIYEVGGLNLQSYWSRRQLVREYWEQYRDQGYELVELGRDDIPSFHQRLIPG